MDINVKRFVDIDIQYKTIATANATRDTSVLLTIEGTAGTNTLCESLEDYKSKIKNLTNTDKFAEIYFNNGGNKLYVMQGITKTTLSDTIATLQNDYIVVAYTGDYVDIKNVAKTREADASIYGVNEKILLGRIQSSTVSSETDAIDNFAVKVSSQAGAEMTIAAYLSNINVYGTDTVHDYSFTKEVITQETNDDTLLGKVIDNNMNVDMYLANATRNLGGNLKDGKDLVNKYMLIVLHQTLTERLLNLLTQKIKGNKGLASIQSVMSDELSKYIQNGYLTTDKIWTEDTIYKNYNNKQYTILEKGTALLKGYQIVILPLSSLTEVDKAKRSTPPIYVVIADSYGIRFITVNGDVI